MVVATSCDQQDDDPEAGERQHGRRDQPERQPRPERQVDEPEAAADSSPAQASRSASSERRLASSASARSRPPARGASRSAIGVRRRPVRIASRRPAACQPSVGVAGVAGAGVDRRDQPVADAADRLDVDRLVRVDLDLLAEAAHRDPDVGRVGVLGLGPAAGEERLGRDGLAEVRGKRVEEARLGRRQLDGLAADGRLAAVQVERQVRAEDEALAGHLVAEPAQDPVDPGPELRVVVGLGDVVLGDLLEQVGLGVAGVDRRQDDDRQVGPGLDLAGEGQAVHPRHHHVDDQEVGPAGPEPAQGLVAVAGGLDLVAVGAELVGEQDEQVRVVVDDEDPRRRLAVARRTAAQHGRRIGAAERRRPPPAASYGAFGSTNRQRSRSGQQLVVRAAGVADERGRGGSG